MNVAMVLAPSVHAVAYQLVCSVQGNKLVATSDHGVVDDVGTRPSDFR